MSSPRPAKSTKRYTHGPLITRHRPRAVARSLNDLDFSALLGNSTDRLTTIARLASEPTPKSLEEARQEAKDRKEESAKLRKANIAFLIQRTAERRAKIETKLQEEA
jgi:hypothetical protein